MRIKALIFIIITGLSLELREAAAQASAEVLKAVENIPLPYEDGIADPNKVLDETVRDQLRDRIHQISSSLTLNCEGRIAAASGRNDGCCSDNKTEDNKQRGLFKIKHFHF